MLFTGENICNFSEEPLVSTCLCKRCCCEIMGVRFVFVSLTLQAGVPCLFVVRILLLDKSDVSVISVRRQNFRPICRYTEIRKQRMEPVIHNYSVIAVCSSLSVVGPFCSIWFRYFIFHFPVKVLWIN